MKPVVVTGVSGGIGRAIAAVLVGQGVRVFGSVRSAEDAAAFETALGPLARALIFDVRDGQAIAAAAAVVAQELPNGGLGGLVNNAGVASAGPLESMPVEAFRDQVEINLTGVLAVTQAFLPLVAAGPQPGRIINVSSVAGATAMPFLGAYAAGKFGLEALSDSLRRELAVKGIRVVVVQPGGIATPIWAKAAALDPAAYKDSPYAAPLTVFRALALAAGSGGLDARRVGDLVAAILAARRPRARYVLSPHPVTERLMRMLPTALLDRLIASRLGLVDRTRSS